jgi:hypothetical protein
MVQPLGGTTWDTCVCKEGFYGNLDESCFNCDPGYYQDQIGAASCKQCPAGTNSYYAAATCVGCVDNMWFYTGMNACYCNKGYIGPPGGPCVACAPGTYSPQTGRTVEEGCDLCSSGYYQDQSGASACLFCAVDTYSSQGAAGCVACNANLAAFVPGTCTNRVQNMSSCPILNGLWTNASPAEVAEFEERMKLTLEVTWESIANQNGVSNTSTCRSRMNDYFCAYHGGADTLFPTCFVGGENLKSCYEVCAAFGSCVSGSTMCASTSPPVGSACLGPNSLPQISNEARDACVCRAGNTRADGVCVECASNTYKDSAGDEACTGCGDGSKSPSSSVSLDACVCSAGYAFGR